MRETVLVDPEPTETPDPEDATLETAAEQFREATEDFANGR
jgi:hypothetical protein